MIKINLLNIREKKKKLDIQRELIIYAAVLLFCLSGVFFHWVRVMSEKGHLRKEISSVKKRLEPLERVTKQIEELGVTKTQLTKRIDIIKKLKANQTGPIRLLHEISSNIPPQVWLVSLSEKDFGIELKGFSFTNIGIANFMKRIEKSGYFGSIELIHAKQTMMEEQKVKEFVIRVRKNTGH